MKQEKKICFRITTRRIAGAILMAASVVNLIIAGTVSAIASPPSSTVTTTPTTSASTTGNIFTLTQPPGATPSYTLTPTNTFTQTPISSPTDTSTPTHTSTPSPGSVPCILQYFWPVYIVQPGDTLFSLAIATGSTVYELMLANCLPSDRIYVGQRLYVPRLPISTPTLTPSVTPTDTPTTPSANTPTTFQDPRGLISLCDSLSQIEFAVTAYDTQGIRSVTVHYGITQGVPLVQTSMELIGATYYGTGAIPDTYAPTVYYSFIATDNLGDITNSVEGSISTPPCPIGQAVHHPRGEAFRVLQADSFY